MIPMPRWGTKDGKIGLGKFQNLLKQNELLRVSAVTAATAAK